MKLLYKLLVTSMIAITLSFFVVTSPAQASRFTDLVNSDGFYYTGTQEGNVVAQSGIFSTIIKTLADIATYLIGIIGLAIRGVFIGWIEIAEMVLTCLLQADGNFLEVLGSSLDNYSQNIVNVENIIFNEVEILDANIFEDTSTTTAVSNIVQIIKLQTGKWYYVLRLISIAFMLVLLIFIGVKMLISTVASEKAIYKQMLVDWVVGMIIVFSIHYIMVAIFTINDSVVDALHPLVTEQQTETLEEYEYGLESEKTSSQMETTLYESARTRAYSLNWTDGFMGMIIYAILVYFAWRFTIMYLIRLFNVIILTLVAPVIAASYAVNKVLTGKSKIFSGWLSEYIMTVIIQIFHVIIYASFISIALKMAMESLPGIILAFVILRFMTQADKILRQLFKMVGGKGSLTGDMEHTGFREIKSAAQNLKTAVIGGQMGKAAAKMTYKIATKPIRVGAEKVFSKYMEKKANEKSEEYMQSKEEINKLEEKKKKLEDVINNQKEQLKLEEENREDALKGAVQVRAIMNAAGIEDTAKEYDEEVQNIDMIMEARRQTIDSTQDDIDDIEAEIEYKRMMNTIDDLETSKGTFVGHIKDSLFDPFAYVESGVLEHKKPLRDKNGKLILDPNGNKIYKYNDGKYHALKTKRRDNLNSAIWRKKKDSVGMRFWNNCNLQNLLGISDKNAKELKNQFKFWKSNIFGVFYAIAGMGTISESPGFALMMLGQYTNARADLIGKRLMLINRPKYLKNKRYRFSALAKDTERTLEIEIERQIREAQKERAEKLSKRHPKLANKILNGESKSYNSYIRVKTRLKNNVDRYMSTPSGIDTIAQEKMFATAEKDYVKRFKSSLKKINAMRTEDVTNGYKDKYKEHEKEVKEQVGKMTERDLMAVDKILDANVAQVGDRLFEVSVKDEFEKREEAVTKKIEKVSFDDTISEKDKINKIKAKISYNKDDIIKNQIAKHLSDNGVTDITKTALKDEDIEKIKDRFTIRLEEKGLIKKGEIKERDGLITSDDVKEVFVKMNTDAKKTNEQLEQKIAANATLEYMQRNNIQNARDLRTDKAREEIVSIVKGKMMTETSKSSASVIEKITGKDKMKDEVQLSAFLEHALDESIGNTDEVDLLTDSKNKKKLEKKQTTRQMNIDKTKLENAIILDSIGAIGEQTETEKKVNKAKLENKIAVDAAEGTDSGMLEMLFDLAEFREEKVKAMKLGKKRNDQSATQYVIDLINSV